MSENKNIAKQTKFVFEGNISVKAAIEANRREIYEIFVDSSKKDRDTNYILKIAQDKNIRITKTTKSEIDKLCVGKTHGGLIAIVGERKYQDLNCNFDCYALIEGVEDPFNFAHILRSIYALGVKGVIVGERNWNVASELLAKTSAGASEHIEMYQSDDFVKTLQHLKNEQYQIIAANRKDAVPIHEYNFPKKVVLCVGGEMRGLSKNVLSLCDAFVFIPYGSEFRNALTAVSATSILVYEYHKQTMKK